MIALQFVYSIKIIHMKTNALLLLMASFLLFASCSKEETLDQQQVEVTAEMYLSRLAQPFVFQFVELKEDGDWDKGWVIDTKGDVYNMDYSAAGAIRQNLDEVSVGQLNSLYNNRGDVMSTVDLDLLKDMYKKTRSNSDDRMSFMEEEFSERVAFFAVRKVEVTNCAGGNCEGGSHATSNKDKFEGFQLITLKNTLTKEKLDSYNTDAILSWLKDINQER